MLIIRIVIIKILSFSLENFKYFIRPRAFENCASLINKYLTNHAKIC